MTQNVERKVRSAIKRLMRIQSARTWPQESTAGVRYPGCTRQDAAGAWEIVDSGIDAAGRRWRPDT
ncbi:hypothetical protein P7H06_25465 [Paenibacillus larvae]|nr:hypothetical protein [Paenibacillus larvae]MDT2262167.1 hypothetical protein [Paenibacillus larvae]